MKTGKNRGSLCSALLVLAAFFCGCHANVYYQARAVDRAREFLLKEADELTLEEQSFVRYNEPILLHAPLLGSPDTLPGSQKMVLNSVQRQICITWRIPTRDKLYLVFGVSRPRMDDWYPNRLIRRSYRHHDYAVQMQAEKAREYAQNNLFDRLDALEINEIRFTAPWLLETDFELNCDPEGKLSAADREALRKEFAGKSQYSLVWKFRDKAVVFCGASGRSLNGWDVNFGAIITLKELDGHTRHVWMTPEQALEPLPEELREPAAVKSVAAPSGAELPAVTGQAPTSPENLEKRSSVPAESSSVEK